MGMDLKNFWQRLQTGVEVAVAGHAPDKLLGVRDGFLRFFHDGMDRRVSVVVVPQSVEEEPVGLLVSDEVVVREARKKALGLHAPRLAQRAGPEPDDDLGLIALCQRERPAHVHDRHRAGRDARRVAGVEMEREDVGDRCADHAGAFEERHPCMVGAPG